MPKKISEVLGIIEKKAPSACAEHWDNTGLLLGNKSWKTNGAVISIDLTRDSVKFAKSRKCKLIIVHHPCIFPKQKGISKLVGGTEEDLSSLMIEAIRNQIAVIACHTNFDKCALEVVEQVSVGLGLLPKGRLFEKPNNSLLKLVVFVPASHLETVRNAISAAGAGHIANYDFCTFSGSGQGSFRGSSSTNPFIGKSGVLEKVDEYRLETVLPRGLEKRILDAMFFAHPYEEVAYDLYPLEQRPATGGLVNGLGYGFWGEFSQPKSFSEFARGVKSLFKLDGYWVTQPPPSKVRRIAFVAGKGSDFITTARALECDVFLTGEAGYHDAISGSRSGIAVMELGHRESEIFFLSTIRGWLAEEGIKSFFSNVVTQRLCLGDKK